MNFFTLSLRTAELKIYSAIVYGKAFQREINLSIAVFCRKDGTEICRKRYFSTDLTQDGMNIVRFNAALTTVNPAKIHWLENRKADSEPFSMCDF